MKKIVILLVSVLMIISLAAGCSNKSKEEGNTEVKEQATVDSDNPAPFKIGFPWATSSTDPTFVSIIENVRAAVESAGGELVLVESTLTADSLINNITDLISRDVDGIIFMPASDSMLPTVNQLCSEAKVKYATMFRPINDDEIRDLIYNSEYFAGASFEDDESCAYQITTSMNKMGVENLAVINIAKGDTSSDLRDAGIARAVRDTGINLLNTTYNIADQTEMTRTIESYLAAYPELDGILLAGTYADAALPTMQKTLADRKKAGQIIVGRIDFDFTMGEYLEKGTFHVAFGGQQQIDPLMATVILVNDVIGTPIKEDGSGYVLITNYLELTSSEEADNFLKYFLGDTAVFTKEEIKEKMIKFYNPNINTATFDQIIADFSIDDVVRRHKDLVN